MKASPFGWQPVALKSDYVFPGERVFQRPGEAEGLLFWCVLVPHQNLEQFTFDIGWSRLGRFPELTMRPSLQRPLEAFGLPEYFGRLGEVSSGQDLWWEVEPFRAPRGLADLEKMVQPIPAETARARVTPVAERALDVLERVGVPYLLEAEARGA
ncbi:hypothetical protein [Caldimonas brevitalea]|uniref:Uncharacterized protein n=1 Tax=Caldimonas brevitalea TaxID=413882 RepID=A0A0G3BJ43_9BURK|nr:hypothetical protein [Caldimonas brevitalea]AKJ27381.1 hypothetical protein AAW51_0690 [Caldimonas brevitalea]